MDLFRRNLAYLERLFPNLKFKVDLFGKLMAEGDSYPVKNKLKKMHFNWNPQNKKWSISTSNLRNKDLTQIKFMASKELRQIKKETLQAIDEVENEFLKKLLTDILIAGPYKEKFFLAPGAKSYHHAYRGGLAEHTLQVLNAALKMVEAYEKEVKINKDLIITAAILHDLGKIDSYKYDEHGNIQVTDIHKKINHISRTVEIVSKYIPLEKENELTKHLIHIILSHHQFKEWGSPVEPQTPEAWIIHFADNLSSKIGG